MSSHGHDEGDEGGHGGDKPWVFFMVDCFFLITEFFVLTFKFKAEESVLPQHLPPGGTSAPSSKMMKDAKEPLRVHVSAAGGSVAYDVMGNRVSLADLSSKLAAVASTNPDHYSVRVSYDSEAEWGNVIAVINACNKVKITECGLVPLRGGGAGPGGRP